MRYAMMLALLGLALTRTGDAQVCDTGCTAILGQPVIVQGTPDPRATTYALIRNGTVEPIPARIVNGIVEFPAATGWPLGVQTFEMSLTGPNFLTSSWPNTLTVLASQPVSSVLVGDMSWRTSTNGWGPAERNRSNGEQGANDGNPITIRGQVFTTGVGVHAGSVIEVDLPQYANLFTATIGVDDETGGAGSVVFEVIADGRSLYRSPTLRGTDAPLPISVPLDRMAVLQLVVGPFEDINSDHADWAAATIHVGSGPAPPPPPPPPPPEPVSQLGTVTATRTVSCRLVISSPPPMLPTSGWSVQFLRNGINIGTADGSSPFTRTVTVGPGLHAITARWTKAGVVTTYRVQDYTCAP